MTSNFLASRPLGTHGEHDETLHPVKHDEPDFPVPVGPVLGGKNGFYAEPWSAETRFSRVDYRDVAEVAAIALTEDRLLFGTFELCAVGNLNRKDVALLMSEVLGRKIEATSLSPDQLAEVSKGSGDKNEPSPMKAMFDWYDAHGLVGNSLIIEAPNFTIRYRIENLATQGCHFSHYCICFHCF